MTQSARAARPRLDQFQALAAHAQDVLFRMRLAPDPGFDYVSPAIEALTGYPAAAFAADRGLWLRIVHPDDRRLVSLPDGLDLVPDELIRFRLVDRLGELHWVEFRAVTIRDERRGTVAVEGVARDITATRRLEDDLRARDERLTAVMEAAPIVLFALDREGIVTLLEGRTLANLQVDPADFLGGSAWERLADRPELLGPLRRAYAGEAVVATVEVRAAVLEIRATPVFDARGMVERIVGVATDVTAQRRSQEQLMLLSAALGAAGNAIIITDRNGVIGWANSAFSRLTGYQLEEAIGRTPRILKSSHQDPAFYRALWGTVTAGRVWHGELINRRRDGSHYTEEMTIAPVRDDRGEITNYVAVKADVSERRAAEAALQESEERFRAVFDEAPIGMVLIEHAGYLVLANRAFQSMLGRTSEELALLTFREIAHPDDIDEIAAMGPGLIADDRPYQREFRLLRSDGELVWVRVHASLIRDADGLPVAALGMVENTTGRRLLEDQLRQAAKMEAVGQLAGGVAHDFNNLLTAINGYAELVAADMPDDDLNRDYVLEIGRAGARAAELTSRLLTFGRRQLATPEPIAVDEVVASVEPMLRRLIGEDVDLVTRHATGLWPALVDRGQLEQVIVNLVVNARDAMPRGGRITITTTNRELNAAYVARHPLAGSGPHVCLEVRDTGAGIPEELQDRIFEPFFTTKEPGRGTGLGLSTVFGAVRHAGGHIDVDTRAGQGATFRIFLPRSELGVPAAESRSEPRTAHGGAETVLLAEDEPAVRAFAARVLGDAGYAVIEAADGGEALSLASSGHLRIDLLVTDIVMPGMGGIELAERILALRPETRVLYVTGYADVDHLAGRDLTAASLVRKPYSVADLTRAVREALDGDADGSLRPTQVSLWPELPDEDLLDDTALV